MDNYLKEKKKKLEEKIDFENLEIVNNSDKHKGHRFFSEDKYHLLLKIKSLHLKSLTRLNAHKIIMNVLKEDLKTKIHALEISFD